MPIQTRPLLTSPEGCAVELPAMSLGYYHQTFGLETARGLRRMAQDMARRYPGGYVSMTVCRADAMSARGYGDEAVRRELTAVMQYLRDGRAELAIVLEGTGFAVATMRAAAVGLSLVLGSKMHMRFFGTVEQAVAWTCEQSPFRERVAPREEILEQLEKLRRTVQGVSATASAPAVPAGR